MHVRDIDAKLEVDRLTRFRGDVFGPFPAARFDGSRYVTVFVDDGGTVYSYFTQNMKACMPDIQRQFIADVRKDLPNAMTTEQIDVHFDQIKVGTDGATYFLSDAAIGVWTSIGAHHYRSPPGEPRLNGRAERTGQALYAPAAALMKGRNAPTDLWPEAWRHAAAVHDIVPSRALPGNVSPHKFRTGNDPTFDHIKPLFARCFVKLLDHRGKWTGKAREGIYLGHNRQSDCAHVLTRASRQMVRIDTRNIVIDDTVPKIIADQRLTTVPDLWIGATDTVTLPPELSSGGVPPPPEPRGVPLDETNVVAQALSGEANLIGPGGLDDFCPGRKPSFDISPIKDPATWATICAMHTVHFSKLNTLNS